MSKLCRIPRVLNPLNFDRAEWSNKHGLACMDPSRAVQDQAAETDINNIVRLFGVTGKLPQAVRIPTYDDFTGTDDYRTAIEAIRAADAAFLSMPSELRAELDNDPQLFLEWCADANNRERMTALGLVNAPLVKPSTTEEGVKSA